jgi:hypothetical protein
MGAERDAMIPGCGKSDVLAGGTVHAGPMLS